METEILSKLGLNQNHIQIYITLLKKGESTANEIASLTKLHRTHVYDLLESLEKRSIVSSIKKENKKFFIGVEPKKLESLLAKKQEELDENKKDLSELIQDLNKITHESKTKALASIYQEKQGFMSQLNEILRTLKKGEEYLVMGFTGKSDETLKYFLPGFAKRRIAQGVKRRIIMDNELRGKEQGKQKLQQIRFLPKDQKVPMGIITYKDKVVIVIIEDDYISIKIENQKIADNFKKYFDLIWKRSKK
ncbi:MAG: hypothetical protein KKF56_03370 [Nanoarchaeota archaeon]|nr:hypothetical protein [Nanoarchaeota archaeon]